jgi:hypothetical protein
LAGYMMAFSLHCSELRIMRYPGCAIGDLPQYPHFLLFAMVN